MQRQIRRQTDRLPDMPVTEQSVRQQIAWAAGTEQFAHRDPIAHMTECFQQTFDEIGRQHAAALAGETAGGFFRQESAHEVQLSETDAQGHEWMPDPTDVRDFYAVRSGEQAFIRRFSETAFQRGTLSGAVMAGSGRMMLVSCLKHTVGQSPAREQQRRLFGNMSQHCGVPGHTGDAVIFNRGMADSAVGLVVDTLRASRRTVSTMADLARGKSNMGGEGGARTLRRMYPFLDDRRERTLVEQYSARLAACADPHERQLMQRAIVRLRALIDKKAQMKQNFTDKLQHISDRATEALTLFETPDFAQTLVQEVLGADAPPEPPDGPPDDGGEEDNHAADRVGPHSDNGTGR